MIIDIQHLSKRYSATEIETRARLFGLRSREAVTCTAQSLADVGLTPHASKGVHQLSNGMRQRLVRGVAPSFKCDVT